MIFFICAVAAVTMSSSNAADVTNFRCREAGRYPTADNRGYIECFYDETTNRLIATVRQCDDGEYFLQSLNNCSPAAKRTEQMDSRLVQKRNVNDPNLFGAGTSPVLAAELGNAQCGPHDNSTGLVCNNRTHVALCLRTITGNDDPGTPVKLVHQCPEDEVCVAGRGCVSDLDLLTRNRTFTCSDGGLYPDPYNCSIYYSCVETSNTFTLNEMFCSDGQIFSARSGTCIARPQSFNCYTDPYCYSVLQVGVLTANSNIYYVCTTDPNYPGDISPLFFRCPLENQVFNPAALACAPQGFNWGPLPFPTIL